MTEVKENFSEVTENFDGAKKEQGAEKSNIDASSIHKDEQKYYNLKKELQAGLIKLYRDKLSVIPMAPLLEEIQTPLAGFYVMPDMVAVKQKSYINEEVDRTRVKSFSDLFSTGNEGQQEIYLTAEEGFGKTVLSKYLAITWCQVHCQDENHACFKDEDLKGLSNFEFLFLILLRDSTDICSIYQMIELQNIAQLPPSVSLEEVLRREKCLIILDGLDEWTHPDNGCSKLKTVPHRYVQEHNCVILTTVRPWKLEASKSTTCHITKTVELVKLNDDAARVLQENAIRKIAGVHDEDVLKGKIRDFNKALRDRCIKHIQAVPLLLVYIAYLWCNEIPTGNSKHEVYTNIVEFLLTRTARKHTEVQPSSESSAIDIPAYFSDYHFCKTFSSLITSLSELAYQTMFNETRENTLVFDRLVADKYLKPDDMNTSLLSGLLSESKAKNLTKEITKVSFSQKPVQEFFAAIFISSQSGTKKTILERCKSVHDILNMSTVFDFISAINVDLMCSILKYLPSVMNEDEKTFKYRTTTGYSHSLHNVQNMYMSCLKEIPENEILQLCLQDFFIDEGNEHSEQLQRLSKQNKTNIKSLYIKSDETSNCLREIVDLFSLTDLSHIQKLYYHSDSKTEADITFLLFPSLLCVAFLSGKWTNNDENMSENLARLQNLQCLHIGRFTLSHKILETILNFISSTTSLKELTLDILICKEHDDECKSLNLDLSQHDSLKKLRLGWLPTLKLDVTTASLVDMTLRWINLDKNSLLLSPDMLNIEQVVFSVIEMSAESLENFMSVLGCLPQSVKVKIIDIEPETEYERVRENIRNSQTHDVIEDDCWFVFKTRN
ncbi:uncharacterized protein LOC132754048 [Ruditapes philippinarum]|uniref:uncharacterized protein LOC132754048 n=1 Tax=Ruditapes philippinarum TaxID=129788 RepID=UPI00295B93C3|nr:uncharacterized protein LOC132754048 [Ruditapes philippinarum]XP_060600617.1 uncharacterized protein LOC132754048 [Ruditapes philippinarum]